MPQGRPLRAGPLELVFFAGDLWHIRLGRTELIERIYMAVRDRNWGTVAGRLENLRIAARDRHFSIHFDAIHRQDAIDFRWRASIIGSPAGEITFSLDGQAHTTFLRNRIGFCVHHPLAACAGRPCRVETASGGVVTAPFPELVAPHQPFLDIRAMRYRAAEEAEIEIRFQGEVFETEDQRNWTDANYKTYGTPLALPFPVEVPAGARISQLVHVKLHGRAPAVASSARPAPAVREESGPAAQLPRIGLAFRHPFSEAEAAQLERLRLSHLRVDLDLASGYALHLEQAAAAARRLGAKLEVAVQLPGDLPALARQKPLVERWLIFHSQEKSTSAATVRAARQALGQDAFLVAGTNAYFAELNRERPSGGDFDAVCFSANPQVHAFDNTSVMANAAAQFDVVRTAREFTAGKPVIVTPITLRPRFNPNATAQSAPPPPDPRQRLPFCAAWTVASLSALARAGAHAVTYYEATGPGGVLDGGQVFPVYEVFRALADFAGGSVLSSSVTAEDQVAALVVAAGARRRLLLANRTAEPLRVTFRGAAYTLAAYGFRVVDWTHQ